MIQLTVNGSLREYDGDPAMPVLWYLRDLLELTGAKFGCGMGLCGCCTVHVEGKRITTIEGLNPNGDHPLQKAWRAVNVPQCGYCQAGQIMQAASLLAQKPTPTDRDIDEAMQGNICRCGTYQRIRQAVKMAAGVKA